MPDILLGQRAHAHRGLIERQTGRGGKGVETVRAGLIHGPHEQGFTRRIMFHMCSSTTLSSVVVVFIDVLLVPLVLLRAFYYLPFSSTWTWCEKLHHFHQIPLETLHSVYSVSHFTVPLPAHFISLCLVSMCWCAARFFETHGKLERADGLHTAHEPCLVSLCFSKPSHISETAFNNQWPMHPKVKAHPNMKWSVQANVS